MLDFIGQIDPFYLLMAGGATVAAVLLLAMFVLRLFARRRHEGDGETAAALRGSQARPGEAPAAAAAGEMHVEPPAGPAMEPELEPLAPEPHFEIGHGPGEAAAAPAPEGGEAHLSPVAPPPAPAAPERVTDEAGRVAAHEEKGGEKASPPAPEPGPRAQPEARPTPAVAEAAPGPAAHAEVPGRPPPPSPSGIAAPAKPRRGKAPLPGPLRHRLPRSMRRGVAGTAEVRLKPAGPAAQPGAFSTVSARLRSPDGAFTIENRAPETQWVEGRGGAELRWRWLLLPAKRGRRELQLVMVSRSIGPDGAPLISAHPEQSYDIRVRGNPGRAVARVALLAVLFAAGIGVGAFIEQIYRWLDSLL